MILPEISLMPFRRDNVKCLGGLHNVTPKLHNPLPYGEGQKEENLQLPLQVLNTLYSIAF